jgi:adenylyltransferase/sulfurtransferase
MTERRRRWATASVLVVGVGGLGCPAAMALARAGVGRIGLADDDLIDPTNLHRQILFEDEDVGRPKVATAAQALRRAAPDVSVVQHATRLLPDNALELVHSYDLIIEGADNYPTKFLAADVARIAERPIVHAAALRWYGTVLAVGPRGGPCYRCLFEDLPEEDLPNCDDAGVVGPVLGIVAAVQADLALTILAGEGAEAEGELFTFDGKTLKVRRTKSSPRIDCQLCGRGRSLKDIDPGRYRPARNGTGCEIGYETSSKSEPGTNRLGASEPEKETTRWIRS